MTPKYEIIRQTLLKQIETGALPPDSLLPDENALAAEYGVSLITVRRAMTELAKDGVIGSQTGIEAVNALPNILHTCYYHRVGSKIVNTGDQLSKTFRAYIVGRTLDEVADTIRKIQSLVEVRDTEGNNMLFDNFDPSALSLDY